MNVKVLRRHLPELYLLFAVLFYWVSSTFINPIALVLFVMVGAQLYFKKPITGVLIASILMLLNLYMVLALISELSEFEEYVAGFWKLLIVGSLFLGLNIAAGVAMLLKYSKVQTFVSQ